MKCIVCGCTDQRGFCEWVLRQPPVCSSCVKGLLFARLWKVVFLLEGVMNWRSRRGRMDLARAAKEIREAYDRIPKGNRFGVPTLRQVTAINRRFEKSKQKKRVKA